MICYIRYTNACLGTPELVQLKTATAAHGYWHSEFASNIRNAHIICRLSSKRTKEFFGLLFSSEESCGNFALPHTRRLDNSDICSWRQLNIILLWNGTIELFPVCKFYLDEYLYTEYLYCLCAHVLFKIVGSIIAHIVGSSIINENT